MKIYLVQRGKFKNSKVEEITGIDSIVKFDYMGSSEFEWGAKPASLKRVMGNYRDEDFTAKDIQIRGVPFVVYCNSKLSVSEIEEFMNNPSRHMTKEATYIDEYFKGATVERLKRNCKKKREVVDNQFYTDFWWDIENDWFAIPAAPCYKERIDIALRKLDERGWGIEKK